MIVTEDLRDVAPIAPEDVWVVGLGGRILHGGVSGWTTVSSGTTEALYGACANSASDVWAVGNTVLHYNGSDWIPATDGLPIGVSLSDVWCGSASEIWAVGASGFFSSDGSTWTESISGSSFWFNGISGTDEALWAVGSQGRILTKLR